VAGLCAYLVIVLYAGRAGHGVGQHVHAGRPAGPLVQFGVSLLFFWWSQHLLLGGRLAWRRLLPGAIGMAAGMTALVGLSGYAMSSEIVAEDADYGLIGSTFVLSLWLVALSGLLCGAALLGELISEHRVRQNNA
jgi:membrane protein